MRREILYSRSPGETRIAVLEGDRLADIAIIRDGLAAVHSIHYGRVVGRLPGQSAMFVDIGDERPGFLSVTNSNPAHPSLREGEPVMVQVTHAARSGKGAKLTQAITLAGTDVVFSPFRPGVAVSHRVSDAAERDRLAVLARTLAGPSEGIVVRAQAIGVTSDRLALAISTLRQRWIRVTARVTKPPACLDAGGDPLAEFLERPGATEIFIRCDTLDLATQARLLCRESFPPLESCVTFHHGEDLFSFHGVDASIEEALMPEVALAGGGRLLIEPTAAVVAIDVDSGGAGSALAVNLQAAVEIGRQIRLRTLSGHMVVDFIGMGSSGDMRRVVSALRSAVALDVAHIAGPTPLGLVEMVRERRRPPLAEFMLEASTVAVALDALRAVLRESAARKVAGLGLSASPDVVAALRGSLRPALEEAERVLGHRLELRVNSWIEQQPANQVYSIIA